MQISIYHGDMAKLLKLAKPRNQTEYNYVAHVTEVHRYAEKFKTCLFLSLDELHLLESCCPMERPEILNTPPVPLQPISGSTNNRPDLVPVEPEDIN